jgi:hypothetical protein
LTSCHNTLLGNIPVSVHRSGSTIETTNFEETGEG